MPWDVTQRQDITNVRWTRTALWLLLTLCLCIGLVWVCKAQSQEQGSPLRVIHTVVEPQEDHAALSVFFTVVDNNGRPIRDARLDTPTIQLLGAPNDPMPVTVHDPQTPIHVVLLLDTSGSMNKAMSGVHEAAKAAIDQAPDNASFAVIPFNDVPLDQDLRPLSGFLTDHNLIKRDIDLVKVKPNGPTCLFNAAYKAIELLDKQVQKPQERRAIILFTDGKDTRTGGNDRCSDRTLDDVIARATTDRTKFTPIFTIGLKEGANSPVDDNVLINLAKATNAYYAIGDLNSMGNHFQEIMTYLNSQLVAFATVCPKQGVNQAVLSAKLDNSAVLATTTFGFVSPINCTGPAAVADLMIQGVDPYDAATNSYNLHVSVDSPANIATVVVKVIDNDANTTLYEIKKPPEAALTINLDAGAFKPAKEYRIEITALDKNGNLIFTQPKPNSTEDAKPLMVQTRIKHIGLEQPKPVAIAVQGAKADFTAKKLVIDLSISEPERVDKYAGFVRNENGSIVKQFGPAVFLLPAPGQPLQLHEELPDAMLKATTPQEYTVIVQVWTKKDELDSKSEAFAFKVEPLPPPGVLDQIKQALQNPYAQATLVVILTCVVGWFLLTKFKPKPKEEPPLPIDHTDVAINAIAVDNQVRVRVKLVRAPNQAKEINKLVVASTCIIGRDESCNVNLGEATPDKRISRQHVEIQVKDGEYSLVDLGSQNGTFINGTRLAPRKPITLKGATTIRLGPETSVEIEPEG